MSTRAYKVFANLADGSVKEPTFNYTHSSLEELLKIIGREMPFDNGGMGVPLVIYRGELFKLVVAAKEPSFVDKWDSITSIIESMIRDMGQEEYVCYWLV